MNNGDKDIVKTAKREKFWQLITDYIEVKKDEIKAGIISWVNEDMSKSKRTDRDILLFKLERLDEILNYPDEIINMIYNQDFDDTIDTLDQ